MLRRIFLPGCLVGLVVLTACTVTELSGGTSQPVKIVAMLERSGGLLGRTETLTINEHGEATLHTEGQDETIPPKTIQVSPDELAALREAVNSAEWQQLEERYGQQYPDAFAYTIIAGGKRVTTYDGVPNPPILDNVLQQLNTIWQRAE